MIENNYFWLEKENRMIEIIVQAINHHLI